MSEWPLLLVIVLPVFLIVGLYRLMARLTARRATHSDFTVTEEERQQTRVFHDD